MLESSPFIKKHLPFLIFYFAFVLIGLLTFDDYGISWDETSCRNELGIVNHNFIFHGDYKTLMESNAKYHGPAFDIFLYEIEKLFRVSDMRSIFLLRHLLYFLLFAVSVLFFYRFCLRYFSKSWLALLGSALLVLSPRIYADAFNNPKDLVFLSMLIISMYTTVVFLEHKNLKTGFLNALISALMIDIRVIGIIVPVFTCTVLIIDILKSKENKIKQVVQFLFFSIMILGLIILFWPVMWRHPLENIQGAFKENSMFPWINNILYLGRNILSTQLPWHYIPIWIVISTPILYLLFFIFGLIFLMKRIFIQRKLNRIETLNLAIIFFPLLIIWILHSVVYDGWRHFYFIYPSIIFISIIGVEKLVLWINTVTGENIIKSVIATYCAFIIIVMIKLHPYENLYFNFIAGGSLKDLKNKFELDYWCVSYGEALKHITNYDKSSVIWIYISEGTPAYSNALLLDSTDRSRIYFSDDPKVCDYYISNYRFRKNQLIGDKTFEVVRGDAEILSVFNMKGKNSCIIDDKYLVNSRMNFKVETIESNVQFAANSIIESLPEMIKTPGTENYMDISFLINTTEYCDFQFVVQVDSTNNKVSHWQDKPVIIDQMNKWIRVEIRMALPPLLPSDEKIKTYILNSYKQHFNISNMEIKLYSAPKIELIEAVKEITN